MDRSVCFKLTECPDYQGCYNSLQHYKMEYFLRLTDALRFLFGFWLWFGEGLSVCFLIMCSLFMILQENLIRRYPGNPFSLVEFLRSKCYAKNFGIHFPFFLKSDIKSSCHSKITQTGRKILCATYKSMYWICMSRFW